MFQDQMGFFTVGLIGVVPLFHVRQAVAERAVAGHNPIFIQTSGRHERGPPLNDFLKFISVHSEIDNAAVGVKLHLCTRLKCLLL